MPAGHTPFPIREFTQHAVAAVTDDHGIDHLLQWMSQRIDATVSITVSGEERATAGRSVPPPDRALMNRLTDGQLATASDDDAAYSRRLHALGARPPHAVLTVTWLGRPTIAPGLLTDVVQMIPVVWHSSRAQQTITLVRLSVLQLLMSGDVTAAQRVIGPLSPNLLDVPLIAVHVLRCTGDRREAVSECQAVLGEKALVVECPVYPQDVIVVSSASGRTADDLGVQLRSLVHRGRRLGMSTPTPPVATASAYRAARRALATTQPLNRISLCPAEKSLAEVLKPDAARRWALEILKALDNPGVVERRELQQTILAVNMFESIKHAASILAVRRDTVADRLVRASRFLGLDLRRDEMGRATVGLAFDIIEATQNVDVSLGDRPPLLKEILSSGSAREWAERILYPLRSAGNVLTETLTVWLDQMCRDAPTARVLGVYSSTVTDRIARCEKLLRRELRHGADGSHVIALALHISTGRPAVLDPIDHEQMLAERIRERREAAPQTAKLIS